LSGWLVRSFFNIWSLRTGRDRTDKQAAGAGNVGWPSSRQRSLPDGGFGFYRAMHFSALRGLGIACRLSVCLSVCDVDDL